MDNILIMQILKTTSNIIDLRESPCFSDRHLNWAVAGLQRVCEELGDSCLDIGQCFHFPSKGI